MSNHAWDEPLQADEDPLDELDYKSNSKLSKNMDIKAEVNESYSLLLADKEEIKEIIKSGES